MIAEMTSASSIVADIQNLTGTSATDGKASGGVDQQAISGIEKMTGATSLLSSQCPFPRRLPPELLVVVFLEDTDMEAHMATAESSTGEYFEKFSPIHLRLMG